MTRIAVLVLAVLGLLALLALALPGCSLKAAADCMAKPDAPCEDDKET